MSRLGELRQEAEWRKCARDEPYFLRKYWHIAHPAHGRILFDLRDAQSATMSRMSKPPLFVDVEGPSDRLVYVGGGAPVLVGVLYP